MPLGKPGNPRGARAKRGRHPAVVVDAAAAHDLEILGVFHLLGLRIVEGVGKADAVEWVLRDAVDHARRRDAQDVVDGRNHIVDVEELSARRGVGLDLRGPADGQRIARAAEVRGDELGRLVRRAARPGPAGVIHVVGLGRAEHVEAAERVERLDMLLGGGGDAVLRQQLADRAVLAFGRGAVVAPDVEDQRVVAVAKLVDFIHDAADLYVHVLGKSGEHLHQAALEGLLVVGDRVPGSQGGWPRGELRVRRNPAQSAWRAGRHARGTCPSRRRTCPCTCRPIPS